MRDALIITTLSILPKKPLARLIGKLNRTRFGSALQRWILQRYVSWYNVNIDECEGTIADYPSLADFFVRALKPGARPIASGETQLVSPVDAKVYALGTITQDRIPQSESRHFSASQLLGLPPGSCENHAYAVLYLSPKDYHRVHTPRTGTVALARYSPGQLWPVFPAATRKIDNLFAQNERLTTFFQTDIGSVALVMVGAFGVGRMRVVYNDWLTNEPGQQNAREEKITGVRLERGQELGRFEMGSTVVLVLPPESIKWTVRIGDAVKMGQEIGVT